jgi:hypothetical protein
MLPLLLLAASALATTRNTFLLGLDAVSPLIRYAPRPLSYGRTNETELGSAPWTVIEDAPNYKFSSTQRVRTGSGGSFSLSLPAGGRVEVRGDLTGDASVTVDGEPADVQISKTSNTYVPWLVLTVPGGEGAHNVSVSVTGSAGVREISAHRSGDAEICLSSTGPHTDCFETHFQGWDSVDPLQATREGSWITSAL